MAVSEVKAALPAPVEIPDGPEEGELLGVKRGIGALPAALVGEGPVEFVKGYGAEVASADE